MILDVNKKSPTYLYMCKREPKLRQTTTKQVQAREHIVQGMLQALGMIDAVIEVVRAR